MINPRIVVFHYHLLPGGVTSVIAGGMEALIKAVPEIREIILVSGRKDNADRIVERLTSSAVKAGRSEVKVSMHHLPDAGYLEKVPESPEELKTEGNKLARQLLDKLGGAPWWIHNYHIGKNPVLTRAIIEAAVLAPGQQFLLQIHDFPESGRFQNLRGLKGVSPLYPDSPNIHYLTINERDRNILIEAGLPAERVVFMANPVKKAREFTPMPPEKKSEIRLLMKDAWGSEFPSYTPEALTAFFPVRSIRRKNILEAGLLTRLSRREMNLIVTLPGVSKQETAYSDIVMSLFKKGIIPGIWGTGIVSPVRQGVPDFDDIASSCDIVLSSSLQEGFGYLFVEAAGWGKRLFSRRMDILEEIIAVLQPGRCRTYSEVMVPEYAEIKAKQKESYSRHFKEIEGFLPEDIFRILKENLPPAEKEGMADFSYLSIPLQSEVLEKTASDPGYRDECRKMNKTVLEDLEGVCSAAALPMGGDEGAEIEKLYGYKSFGIRIRTLLASLETISIQDPAPGSNSDTGQKNDRKAHDYGPAVLRAFNTPEYHRLIFQPFTGDFR